jgi:hypothetical protein
VFNETGDLKILVDGTRLFSSMDQALQRAGTLEKEFYANPAAPTRPRGAWLELAAEIKKNKKYEADPSLLWRDLYVYGQAESLSNGQASGDAAALEEMQDRLFGKARPRGKDSIRHGQRWARVTFIALWSQGSVLLPACFNLLGKLPENVPEGLCSDVALSLFRHPTVEVRSFGPKAIFATSWHRKEDLNWPEIGDFHSRFLLVHPTPLPVRLSRWPMARIVEHLVEEFGGAPEFRKEDHEVYNRWILKSAADYTFLQYRDEARRIAAERRKNYYVYSRKKQIGRELHRSNRAVQVFGPDLAQDIDLTKPTAYYHLLAVAQETDPVKYYLELRKRRGVRELEGVYPGREHAAVSWSKNWIDIREAWLATRSDQGFESDESHKAGMRLLEDYLFCYLPWWKELNPGSEISLPKTPAEFARHLFCLGKWPEGVRGPKGLYEMIRMRRASDAGFQSAVLCISMFFDYAILNKNLHICIAEKMFINPISATLDLPRRFKRSKTSKGVFPKRIMPYLLRYAYEAERFGIHIQQACINGVAAWKPKGADTANVGATIEMAPFKREGSISTPAGEWKLTEFPSALFGSASRARLVGTAGEPIACWIPHLGALRLCISVLETGLRAQSIQWLDRETFDGPNAGRPKGLGIYDLLVNTDKVKNEPWKTPIAERTREVLLREKAFQEACLEDFMGRRTPYEGRKNSRFDPVLPLFRTSGTDANPINDTVYNATWVQLLWGFQKWYNTQTTDDEDAVDFVAFKRVEGDLEDLRYSPEGYEYSPIRLAAKYTPHSARSSFVSHRAGVLETDEVASLVGHQNSHTTIYYTVEDYDALKKRALVAQSGVWEFDAGNPVHIRADNVNSALRRSFAADRAETERVYGFASISLINSEDDASGVERLRTTAAADIAFRETHICPVGEVCPADVMDVIVQPRRCGLCPIAVKCVDHVTAMTAKRHKLLEQAMDAGKLLDRMRGQGEPTASLEEIAEARRLDLVEALGWQRAIELMETERQRIEAEGIEPVHVERPETVRLHLKMVARTTDAREFLLKRLDDAVAYPVVQTPALEARARQLRQRLLAGRGLEEAARQYDLPSEIEAFLRAIQVAAKALGQKPTYRAAIGLISQAVDMLDGSATRLLPAAE